MCLDVGDTFLEVGLEGRREGEEDVEVKGGVSQPGTCCIGEVCWLEVVW